jgi:hypothetical protein
MHGEKSLGPRTAEGAGDGWPTAPGNATHADTARASAAAVHGGKSAGPRRGWRGGEWQAPHPAASARPANCTCACNPRGRARANAAARRRAPGPRAAEGWRGADRHAPQNHHTTQGAPGRGRPTAPANATRVGAPGSRLLRTWAFDAFFVHAEAAIVLAASGIHGIGFGPPWTTADDDRSR